MPDYTIYTLVCSEEHRELLIALLADAGMEAFEETQEVLIAYAADAVGTDWPAVFREVQQRIPFAFEARRLEQRNWNAEWERDFAPIRIGERLAIRASFHPPQAGVTRELVIDPKMAFGTGHHATTHMMCELLLDYFAAQPQPQGVSVLDYGSGTGVLAILAKQLGAQRVDAVDIEQPAYESTLENAVQNGVELNEVVHGELSDVPIGKPYDLVLANINRNVLLASGGALYGRLRVGGTALLSGVLAQDAAGLIDHLQQLGFRHRQTAAVDDWRAFAFERD
ncbi:50S ribosomal protein L11 methyltransferase [Neolewinella sp.]|uniref:50S ribosomal protein L11 methyltransferase n=1 Tax=Neolewinella sp. TaxID=2993543 RepID=UPI003B52BEC1